MKPLIATLAVLAALSGGAAFPRVGAAPAAAPAAAKESSASPAEKPVTTAKGQLGDLLRKWYADGAAAGNTGDFYDNRDRGHSGLDIGPYPQLQKVAYSEDELKVRRDWALQGTVLPFVVFGNSSTSAGAATGGSNTRMAYSHPRGLLMLSMQYAHNNIYIYPEHQDHDPGHNGSSGYGDLFPTNTPYVITSQGSSGSDQPFMRAIPYALAAFRPEVKRKLVETGLLAPTLQMILRRTNKQVPTMEDYLTGKAHPSVFEGSWVDDLKMAQLAHEIRIDDIPPMIQLRVVEEDKAEPGRDFFDVRGDERLGDTVAVIARIFRSTGRTRRMVVSAEASYDLNKRPLAFRWVVLRGDASQIRLTPRNESGSVCEIVVPWHERRPVSKGSELESNRVDIGVFIRNGTYWSAPGFVTFFCLDDEARTYDDAGRTVEIGYGLGTTDVSVPNWTGLLDLLKPAASSLGARILRKPFKDDEVSAILQVAEEYALAQGAAETAKESSKQAQDSRGKAAAAVKAAKARREEARAAQDKTPGPDTQQALDKAQAELSQAEEAAKKAETDANAARQAADASARKAADVLDKKRDPLKAAVKSRVEGAIKTLAADPDFYRANAKAIADLLQAGDAGRKSALESARRRLVGFGLAKDGPDNTLELTPLRGAAGLTRYEQALLEQFNVEILARMVFPGMVNLSYKRNYVDPRLAGSKTWRDVYRYNPKGECIGWTRYDGRAKQEFNAWGQVVLERDSLGRCIKAQSVRYELDVPKGPAPIWNGLPLKYVLDSGIAQYEYADDSDWRGRLRMPSPETGK